MKISNKIIYICSKNKNTIISCPDKNNNKWNLHPRIYLYIYKETICPYCNIKYIIK